MDKIFLCHSSKDKEYVSLVSKLLGRSKVVYDEWTFEEGQDFRDSILAGLEKSSLFVFFASENSKTYWCDYEIDEAEWSKITGKLENTLTIIIDEKTKVNSLPRWMRKTKVCLQRRPKIAARLINENFLRSIAYVDSRPFIDREEDMKLFEDYLINKFPDTDSKIFLVHGLNGIGRRTYLSRAIKDKISLQLGPTFFVDDATSLEDIYFWLLDETSELYTQEQIKKEIESFSKLDLKEQCDKLKERVKILCNDKYVPTLVDEGGILDWDSNFKEEYIQLIKSFKDCLEIYFAFLLTRKPSLIKGELWDLPLFTNYLKPLTDDNMLLLLTTLLREIKVASDKYQLRPIIRHLDGYPTAAYLAKTWIKDYGLSAFIGNVSEMDEYKAKTFLNFISNIKLTSEEKSILKFLSGERPLPLSAISLISDKSIEETSKIIYDLIDKCLIIHTDDNYSISPPIRIAIQRNLGFLGKTEYERISKLLSENYWKDDNNPPSIEIVDATLHSIARSGKKDFKDYSGLIRASTIVRQAKESYNRGEDYSLAESYALKALEIEPNNTLATSVLFRSYVRLGSVDPSKWDMAKALLPDIKSRFNLGFYYYLEGFMYWKMGKYPRAITSFQGALDSGNRSHQVLINLAECLIRVNDHKNASKYLFEAIKIDPNNPYGLDLLARTLIDSNLIPDAEEVIKDLERCDIHEQFIHFRKSRFYLAKKNFPLAFTEAEEACKNGRFEAFTTKADIYIEQGNFPEAEKELDFISKKFGKRYNDVQVGLRIKLMIRKQDWRKAELLWEQIKNKKLPVQKTLFLDIMRLKIKDKTLLQNERDETQKIIDELQKELDSDSSDKE